MPPNALYSASAWNTMLSQNAVHANVEKGLVTRSGQLGWECQRNAAYAGIRNLLGVVGVVNNITIRPQAQHEQRG